MIPERLVPALAAALIVDLCPVVFDPLSRLGSYLAIHEELSAADIDNAVLSCKDVFVVHGLYFFVVGQSSGRYPLRYALISLRCGSLIFRRPVSKS